MLKAESMEMRCRQQHTGVTMSMFDFCWRRAWQRAACKGHHAIVQLLLEKGTDVNATGGLLGTALQAAAESGHYPVVQSLLQNGADVNVQGEYASGPLDGTEPFAWLELEPNPDDGEELDPP
jgi:Ankyrin repeats (3 copies)